MSHTTDKEIPEILSKQRTFHTVLVMVCGECRSGVDNLNHTAAAGYPAVQVFENVRGYRVHCVMIPRQRTFRMSHTKNKEIRSRPGSRTKNIPVTRYTLPSPAHLVRRQLAYRQRSRVGKCPLASCQVELVTIDKEHSRRMSHRSRLRSANKEP